MKNNPLSEIIARTSVDKAFREEFINHPVELLQREGVDVPPGVTIKIVENTDDRFHIVIPATVGEEPEAWIWKGPSTPTQAAQCGNLSMSWDAGTLCLAGRITTENAPMLLRELDKAGKTLVVDFSGVSFMGSAGLSVLLATQKRLSGNGQQIFLCEVPDPIKNLFHLAGLETLFKFVGNNMKYLWWVAFPTF
jgi:anti-anti-sigma factor